QLALWLSYLAFAFKPFHFQLTNIQGGVILMSGRMKRLKLYLETSVWNLLLSEEDPIRRAITESFFQQIALGGYDLYVSEVVTLELGRTKDPAKRQALLAALNDRAPELLAERPELERLAQQFVSQKVFPPRYLNDARHLAYA